MIQHSLQDDFFADATRSSNENVSIGAVRLGRASRSSHRDPSLVEREPMDESTRWYETKEERYQR
jgi:hypothetical protein